MAGYRLTDDDGSEFLTVLLDNGEVLSVDHNHPKFNEIKSKVVLDHDYSDLEALLKPGKAITAEFAKLSTELSIRGDTLYLEGEALAGVLAEKIIDLFEQGEDYGPFVAFLEKLHTNPNPHSVDHLYRWLTASDFVIADDGDIIGYKGLSFEGKSLHSGPVVRNGEPFDGYVPNAPGDVIEMDRSQVQFDPGVGCATGLHVGTWEYARGFGTKVVKVKVNPKYVVSVPSDSSDQKMRVCRYSVIEEITGPVGSGYDRGYVEPDLDDDNLDDYYSDSLDAFDDDDLHTEPDGNTYVFDYVNKPVRKFLDGVAVQVADNPRDSDGDYIGDIVEPGEIGIIVGFDGDDYQVEFNDGSTVFVAPESLEHQPKPPVDDPSQIRVQKKFGELRAFPGMNGYSVSRLRSADVVDTRLNYTKQKRDAKGRFLPKGQ